MTTELTQLVERRGDASCSAPTTCAHMPRPSMGSEDFAVYLEHVPGRHVSAWAWPATWTPITPLHTPTFDVDEAVLGGGGEDSRADGGRWRVSRSATTGA